VTVVGRSDRGGDPVDVVVDGRPHRGTALDLRATSVTADALLAGLRADDEAPDDVRVDGPAPGPLGETLGAVDGGRGVDRHVLAAVARTRGHTVAEDRTVDRLERRLADLDPPSVDRRTARRRLAEAAAETERRRERVAELRGRLRERRAADDDVDAAEAALSEAMDELLDAETERVAARQRLGRARSAAASARDVRDERLELQDRIDNRRRTARAKLAGEVLPAFASALADAPAVHDRSADGPLPRTPAVAELAAYRCGRPAGPVVVAAGPFDDPRAAAAWLDAPVLMV